MSDMADFTNECNEMDEFYPREDSPLFQSQGPKTCRHCGAAGLRWAKNGNGKWWLWVQATGEFHKCAQDAQTAEGE